MKKDGGLPNAMDSMTLTQEEIKRYSRHILLQEFGIEGQERLKASSVLLVGVGGLGSPAAMYLAASGVGCLGLVDYDQVDASNLQRQIIYGTSSIGKSKLEVAADRLRDINPTIQLDLYEYAINAANALDIIKEYDVVLDGTDNFQTRYLVNDACVLLGKANVYGAIQQFQGQASVFWAGKGPCYRCLYPKPPAAGVVPACSEAGVLGVLPGIIGTIQATEAIKLLVNKGKTLVGRMLLYDALELKFTEVSLQRNRHCPVCGEEATIKELVDDEKICGSDQVLDYEKNGLTPYELKTMMEEGNKVFILDVREKDEVMLCQIDESFHIPLGAIKKQIGSIPKSEKVVAVCHLGIRSMTVVNYLKQEGYNQVYNLTGGIDRWASDVDPSMERY